jgi:hypothetical protein
VTDIIPFKHPRAQLLTELMNADAKRAHELFVACPPGSRADLLIDLLQSTTAPGAVAALFGAYDEPDLRHIHADLTSYFARHRISLCSTSIASNLYSS